MRLLEFVLFYIGVPVGVWVTGTQDLLLPVLWLGAIFAWTMLRYGHCAQSAPARIMILNKEIGLVIIRFLIVAAVLTVALYFFHPEWLLWLPRKSLRLWGLVIVFYPLLSVYPQALVYRLLFESRYAKTFSSPRVSMCVGALVFCLAHIPFRNVWALAFTLPAGFLFLLTYRRTGSAWITTVEHALYGDLLFTVGWGIYLVNSGTLHLLVK